VALLGQSSGVISYTLNSLSSNTTYYIQIRAGNGCMPGRWSNEIKITTTKKSTVGGIRYYKDFVSRIFSIFPSSLTVISSVFIVQPQPTTKSCLYTVQSGDSLWGIAQSQLGNGMRYQEILQSNNLTSTIIFIGQTLKVGC
jgi:LysM repeat protein